MMDDKFYIEKVLSGESDYFAFLVEKYQNHIFNIVDKIVKNYDVSQDIVQETFLKAFKGLNNFDISRPFFSYLVQIAMNHTKDYFNKEKRRKLIKEHIKMRSNTEKAEKIKEMYNLIYELPESYREIILLYYRDGKSINEISLLKGISVNNVKVKLFRGRKLLFSMWKKHL